MLRLLAITAVGAAQGTEEEPPQRFHIRGGQVHEGGYPSNHWHRLDHYRLKFHQTVQHYWPAKTAQKNKYDGAHWGSREDGKKYFWEPGWVDDGLFDPREHDPRFMMTNATRRRRLEENRCEAADICCSLCKNDLQTCWRMAGYLVEDKYYPSEQSVTGSCDDIDRRVANLDVFGPSKTFRDNDLCRRLVNEYMCLWWGSEGVDQSSENHCSSKGVILVAPCRPFCVQVAIQCANSLDYQRLCQAIPCPPIEETCMPEPRSVATVTLSKTMACYVYRYSTLANMQQQDYIPGNSRAGALAPSLLSLLILLL